mmetsp:Transcript_15807/g.24596  ORF Transcript_15807/g.24596 Transcript_15807/m.24596 type:complete len:626 (-) Transcript_15807:138-2015(-)|eukprot:CAMPEP_0195304360 /NCGR_PEP_ID=MMETSP0707-20130614/34290_1 /TAXON_ID=33640 /ORGANISM="Asterionellopsis glacialis, Strain CCMP134" /LENGTH=625 /DNA_ID=CAMNT_0040368139 /DNA_START=67 /DNA_END=1944 /DNA_ORIENTATION=+
MASGIFCSSAGALENQSSHMRPVDNSSPAFPRSHYSHFGDGYSVGEQSGPQGVPPHQQRLHDELEADYDSGATTLYKRIEGKDWDGAIERARSAPFEAKTWVSRKEQSSNKTRWRLLPIHATCIFRSPLALIEALIQAYPDGPQMKDDQGMLPIHLACRNGASKGVVMMLLNAFPEAIRVRDRKGRLPLDLVESSTSQNKEAVIVSMKKFQTEGKRSDQSVSTRQSTVVNGNNEVDYEHRTVLFRLVLKKDWRSATARANTFADEASTWIVTKGFNGNLRFLPLHKACVLSPTVQVIEALLAANSEGAKARDQDGWLPIHCACFYGAKEDVVETLLLAHPKGAQSKDDEGRLPLHYACLKGASQGIVDALLQHFPKGAMSKDDEGRLPIHHACSKGAPDGVVEALLKATPKGAQSKDDQGRLPLHHACRKNGTERTIRTLLRVYPRAAQVKDDQDKLPVHYACANGANVNVINTLLTTYPESINVKNGFGYTPLAEAKAVENPEKMEAIIQVLEKFREQQDKIKADSSENKALEAKVQHLQNRVRDLESSLTTLANIGKDLKLNLKKETSPQTLLTLFADKLSTIDVGIDTAPALPSPRKGTPSKKSGASPLRFLRSTSNSRGKR